MSKINVILIFDVGKTNKKWLLFNDQYEIVQQAQTQLEETNDEDGFACEDRVLLKKWVLESYDFVLSLTKYEIKAIHISAYGASFVYLDDDLNEVLPLFNYLKPYPEKIKKLFLKQYGPENSICQQTASPLLWNLNSGLQLFRIKKENPEIFKSIKYALHLPQYISFLLTGIASNELTSIGCHTMLWDFEKNQYHDWVLNENMNIKFPPISKGSQLIGKTKQGISIGVGLHDSSAALVPYLKSFNEPFILISTGTWCISLNPFNYTSLTSHELQNDCLLFISYFEKPVKAARIFAGNEHEQQVKLLSTHFNLPKEYYKTIQYDPSISLVNSTYLLNDVQHSFFAQRSLASFENYEKAYHQLIFDIVCQQAISTELLMEDTRVNRIFVDGGFAQNPLFMKLLSMAFPNTEVYAASVHQASSIGAALALHDIWNSHPYPSHLVKLKKVV